MRLISCRKAEVSLLQTSVFCSPARTAGFRFSRPFWCIFLPLFGPITAARFGNHLLARETECRSLKPSPLIILRGNKGEMRSHQRWRLSLRLASTPASFSSFQIDLLHTFSSPVSSFTMSIHFGRKLPDQSPPFPTLPKDTPPLTYPVNISTVARAQRAAWARGAEAARVA